MGASIRELWRSERQSARMSKIKNGGLDQYGAGPCEQQQFGTAGVERVTWPTQGHATYVWPLSYGHDLEMKI